MGADHDSYPLAGATAVDPHPNFPSLELAVLDYWAADDTFRASVEQRPAGENGSNEFVFYDGPPFANGLPHYGHLLTGYVKDLVPRYQTMRGRRVERRFGWDTHGLPAELEAMDQLGIKTKEQILELGIEKFNEACRASVLRYTNQWRDYVTRQARWVDFDHDYKTLNPEYMESVIWAFKKLYDKGLIYEGFRVLPYCWNDQTPLSSHELRMDDDVYQLRRDPAVTVGLRLETTGDDDPLSNALALIWTTTPWTLTANLAIMVHPEIDYVVVESDTPTGRLERYLIAEARLAAYRRELGDDADAHVLARFRGSELSGRSYTPPMSYYTGHPRAFRVVEADFVTTGEGTGLVHTAGAFGEEDKMVTDREGIEPVIPVGPDGRFRYPVVDYEGLLVFDANQVIIDHLKAATGGTGDPGPVTPGTVLLRRESYEHSYPHCWRCRNPLIYMAVSSWFVEVTAFKQRMVQLNQQINWVPANVRDGQFGKWLENARDWSITRNRFWGSPVPVWKSDNPAYPRIDVYGSFAELERDFGVLPMRTDPETGARSADLHRPSIDRLTRPNPDDPTGQSTMRRVEDVLDVWFDSGSMSYAQVHYPFEDGGGPLAGPTHGNSWFETHFPADFIVEYIGQTRGWFYMLHILATALFDKPAFTDVICHGIVLGSDGQKMSKSLRNYPDVTEVFDRDGADAMRWFLMSSAILRGGNLIVTEEGIREGVRQAILPLWNAWYFLALYAGASGGSGGQAGTGGPGGQAGTGGPGGQAGAAGPSGRGRIGVRRTDSRDVLDRYILAKTAELVAEVTTELDAYDIAGACGSVRNYLEVLTNWYIRRSRQRFWDGDADAIDTLHTVLETVCRVAAPLLPLTAETIWRGLTGGRSVHLTDWPAAGELPADAELVAAMDRAREVASIALAVRKAAGLRVRQPLAAMVVSTANSEALQPFSALLADEVNVASVSVTDLAEDDERVRRRLSVNARAAGPRLGREVQQVIKAAKSDDWWVADDGVVTCGGHVLVDGEYTLELVAADDGSGAVGVLPGGGYLWLDTELSDELVADGVVNDLLRVVQQARRDAGLQVSDRIVLTLDVSDAVWAAVQDRADRVAAETLAVELRRAGTGADGDVIADGDAAESGGTVGTVGDGESVRVRVDPAGGPAS